MPRDFAGPFDGFDSDELPIFPVPVKSLKLEFSKAADYQRIDRVLDPANKHKIDPDNYVVKRLGDAFRRAVDGGHAVMLSDELNEVQALTIAYHGYADENAAPGPLPDVTEFGTTIAQIPGFGSAQLVAAALALKEWWESPAQIRTVAVIKDKNIPSVKTYTRLGWVPMDNEDEINEAYAIINRTLTSPPTGENQYEEARAAGESLYDYPESAIADHAAVMLTYMRQHGLMNKFSGEYISVDFSAMDEIGLGMERLEAMANGEINRAALRKIGSGPSPAF